MRVHPQPAPAEAAAARRDLSVPERLTLAGLALVPAAFVYPALSAAAGVAPACPLRAVTGVPCPLCGGTTAAVALTEGRLADSVAANPAVAVLAALTVVMAAVLAGRATGVVAPPRSWTRPARRRATIAIVVFGAASWVFQLGRLGWL